MPNRVLKESICYSADIDRLTPFEETVFYRILVRADDYGNLDGRLDFLKSVLFTTKPSVTTRRIKQACDKLFEVGVLIPYQADGKPYLHVTNWNKHQRLRNSKAKCPQFAASCGENPPKLESQSQLELESQLFNRFWSVYPKKAGKRDAEEWFLQEKPSVQLVEQMCSALMQLRESEAWRKEDGRFIPKAINWLRDDGWEQVAKEDVYGATI